ncbi:patatin-like phospholipase family protein [Streptomyces sp. CA-106131]|uniref:patatin-like phospholipase family protein n=1 Tax=Streptomyces sp. CA-106131 TaxID=3240045 RepID=UPI003D8AA59B
MRTDAGTRLLPPTWSTGGPSAGLCALPRPVAVVVGAGDALGAAHVGVGYALERRGVVPDMIIDTSVGALNGAIAAAHPDRAAPRLDHVRTQSRRREVHPLGYLSSRVSNFTDRGPRRLIARVELSVPFAAVAMDLVTGAPVLLDHGDLEPAPPAGAAIPGMPPPVDRGGRTLVERAAGVVVLGPGSSPLRPVEPRRRAGATPPGPDYGRRITGPGRYRADGPSAASASPGKASTSSLRGVGL